MLALDDWVSHVISHTRQVITYLLWILNIRGEWNEIHIQWWGMLRRESGKSSFSDDV